MIASYSKFGNFAVTNSFKKLITTYEIVQHVRRLFVIERAIRYVIVMLEIS